MRKMSVVAAEDVSVHLLCVSALCEFSVRTNSRGFEFRNCSGAVGWDLEHPESYKDEVISLPPSPNAVVSLEGFFLLVIPSFQSWN